MLWHGFSVTKGTSIRSTGYEPQNGCIYLKSETGADQNLSAHYPQKLQL